MQDEASPPGLLLQTEPEPIRRRRLRWYLNRLRCMSPAELPFRAFRLVSAQVERIMPIREVPAPDLSRTTAAWIQPPRDIDPQRYLAAADAIVAGRFDVFAL